MIFNRWCSARSLFTGGSSAHLCLLNFYNLWNIGASAEYQSSHWDTTLVFEPLIRSHCHRLHAILTFKKTRWHLHVYDLTFMCGGRADVGGVTGETADNTCNILRRRRDKFWIFFGPLWLWLWRPKQVFLFKTPSFPNPYQVVVVSKPSQTTSVESSQENI